MTGPAASRILNDATSQIDRLRGAPAPEKVAVDGRSMAQLLAFAAQYGALITFYDLDNQANGDWSEFFAADPAVTLAMHAALDLPEIERSLHDLIAELRATFDHGHHHRHARADLLHRLLGILARLIAIHDRVHPGPGSGAAQLARLAPQRRSGPLGDPLHRAHGHLAGRAIDEDFDREPHRHDDWLHRLLGLLDDLVNAVIGELQQGSVAAAAQLARSLDSGGHAPQAALYNAFVQLFVEARGVANTFPRRLVDFYYGDVLRQHRLEPQPGQLFLAFTTAQKTDSAAIARDTVFLAGTDPQGAAINYAANAALEVTPAIVSGISVHRVTRSRVGPHTHEVAPSGVLSGEVALQHRESFPLFGTDRSGVFGPLTMQPASLGFSIGTPTLMLCGGERSVEMDLTVSHASLSELGRKLHRAPAGIIGNDFFEFLAAMIQATFVLHYSTAGGWVTIDGYTVTPAHAHGTLQPAIFTLAFDLPADAPPLVSLATKPATGAPPLLVPASAFPDHLGEASVVGSVRPGIVKPDASADWLDFNRFAILSSLEVIAIDLRVAVTGLTGLTLSTPTGPADATQNFALFGLPPVQGAALDIAAPELFAKSIDSLAVTIDWVGLPVTSTGFRGYYQGYTIDPDGVTSYQPLFDNRSFRAAFSVVNPGLWNVGTGAALYLFDSPPSPGTPPPTPAPTSAPDPAPTSAPAAGATPAPTPLLLSTVVAPPPPDPASALAPSTLLVAPGLTRLDLPPYYNPAASALRLTLTDPPYAFGNILYASNMMAATAATLTASTEARTTPTPSPAPSPPPPPVLPNPPWLPMASAVAVSYSSSASFPLQRLTDDPPFILTSLRGGTTPRPLTSGQLPPLSIPPAPTGVLPVSVSAPPMPGFLHVGPFDRLKPPGAATASGVNLLPEIDLHAALYIQLSVPVEQISLLFVLEAGPNGWWNEKPDMLWEQYVAGAWTHIALLEDSTNGLANSGIVTLRLKPPVLTDKPPRLRVRAMSEAHNAPLVKAVTANALTAHWIGPGGAAGLGNPLPAGTITKSQSSIAGLGSIAQPMQSFGGRPPATGDAFQMWMAERLRHKGFGIDAWDYARLVLEAVPSLWQAGVVCAVDEQTGQPAPGKVWVVAVAGPNTPNITDPTEPLVDLTTLSQIGTLLADCVSPFVELAVTNPPYLRLTVTADLLFSADDTIAFWTTKLQDELVRWLSPWPDPSLGARPANYYTKRAVAEFIRHRHYVLGIVRLDVTPEARTGGAGWFYLTSAQKHVITGIPPRPRGAREQITLSPARSHRPTSIDHDDVADYDDDNDAAVGL